jgi:hypothetical protein
MIKLHTLSLFILVLLLVLLKPTATYSQDSNVISPISYSGFFDAYYIKNTAGPVTGINKIRVFDPADNEFNLALGEVDFFKKAEPVGFRVDIGTGKVAGISLTGLIQQAYVTVVVPVGSGLTVDVGQFVTHIGYEVIESKDNWNYSRSILFGWAIPFYHTGARLSYPVLSNLTATVSVLNGWNSTTDNNKFKTLGFMFNYAMLPSTSITVCGIGGVEQSEPIISGKRNVINLIVTHSLTDNLSFALEADYGEERLPAGLATWKGGAVYGRYLFNAKSAVAVRYEMYNDGSDYSPLSTGASKLSEITATYEYKPYDNLILRGEARTDMSDKPFFDGTTTPGTEKSQMTLLIGAIVTF